MQLSTLQSFYQSVSWHNHVDLVLMHACMVFMKLHFQKAYLQDCCGVSPTALLAAKVGKCMHFHSYDFFISLSECWIIIFWSTMSHSLFACLHHWKMHAFSLTDTTRSTLPHTFAWYWWIDACIHNSLSHFGYSVCVFCHALPRPSSFPPPSQHILLCVSCKLLVVCTTESEIARSSLGLFLFIIHSIFSFVRSHSQSHWHSLLCISDVVD